MVHRIAVLALPPVIGFDTTIPSQVFGMANSVLGAQRYDVQLVGLSTDPIETFHGYSIVPQSGPRALADADSVIIPGTNLHSVRHTGELPDEVREALAQIRPGTRMISICTGAFVLAAAGLLDGRPATTHWAKEGAFRRLYPNVDLRPNVLFTDDGDVLTSAGLAAGTDLCLHVLRKDCGAELANQVARHLVVPPWREGGQAQFIDRATTRVNDDSTATVRQWAIEHLEQRHTVGSLARRAHMSQRTFARRFRDETGQSPAAWLIQQRVREAQRLLETTDLPIDTVADRAGLGTGASLRQHMRRLVGVGPATYRRTFHGPDAVAS